MPNWTTNSVYISCPMSVRESIINALQGTEKGKDFDGKEYEKETVFDFNKLVPMPEHSDDFQAHGNLKGDVIHSGKPRTTTNNWYDWSIEHWGTKWPAVDAENIMSDLSDEPDTEIRYRFLTAWDAPRPIVEALRKKMDEYDATVEWYCVHEDGAEEETL